MLSINVAVILGFLFSIAIAVIILRWMREAEEAVQTASAVGTRTRLSK